MVCPGFQPATFSFRTARARASDLSAPSGWDLSATPVDVLRMSTDHIAGGMLHVRQGKTAAKLRIEVTGALQELLAEIQAYKVQLKADTALLL